MTKKEIETVKRLRKALFCAGDLGDRLMTDEEILVFTKGSLLLARIKLGMALEDLGIVIRKHLEKLFYALRILKK